MDAAERLLETAADCYLLSEDLTDPRARLRMMEMARLLREMADCAGATHQPTQDKTLHRARLRIQ